MEMRMDSGGEFGGYHEENKYKTCLVKHGTKLTRCGPYAHHQNRVAERFNLTIANGVRTVLHDVGLPDSLWGEAT